MNFSAFYRHARGSTLLAALVTAGAVIPHTASATPTYQFQAAKPQLRVLAATMSTEALAFPATAAGTASDALSVLLLNQGGEPLTLGPSVVSGPFSATTSCASSIAPGDACGASVTFLPSGPGDFSGQLVIPTSAGNKTVALSGRGLQALLAWADVVSSKLIFGSVAVGAQAPAIRLPVRNNGNIPGGLTVPAPSGTGANAFPVTSTCASVDPGAACEVTVGFVPPASGAYSATLPVLGTTFTLSGSGAPAYASTAILGGPFPSTNVGTSATVGVAVTNTGMSTLSLGTPAASGDFGINPASTSCGTALAPNASCQVGVAFTPTTFGNRTGTFTLPVSGGDKSIALSATGMQASFALTGAPAATYEFPATAEGTAQPTMLTLAVQNVGNLAGSLAAPVITGTNATDFSASTTCSNIAASGSCTTAITFAPKSSGSKSATFSLLGTNFTVTGQANPAVTYATWDPVQHNSAWTLSNSNLTAVGSPSGAGVRSTVGKTSGKWYWEVTYQGANPYNMIGIVNNTVNMQTAKCFGCSGAPATGTFYVAYQSGTWGVTATSSNYTAAGPAALKSSGPTLGDTYGFAMDLDNHTLKVYYKRNGYDCAGPYLSWSGIPAVTWYAAVSSGGQSNNVLGNFGQNGFACAVPTGYTPLN